MVKEAIHRIMVVQAETFAGYQIYFCPFQQDDINHTNNTRDSSLAYVF